ncbi:MAG: DUF5667 domain-containing protein [candidate division WOR-3 bacterium]|nr:DUF5667 domain-containing protein [candidate division WOR-3 bacterium]
MKQRIEDVLDELIAEICKGKTIGDCLSKYPQYEEELRPLLELAVKIDEIPTPEPDVEAVRAAMSRVQKPLMRQKRLDLRGFFAFKTLPVRAIAIFLFLFVFEMTTVSLSAKSLPGHFLYPVKRFAEEVQHLLTIDSEGMARLHVVLAGRRTHELSSSAEPGVPLNCALLSEMLHEIDHAIEHLVDLRPESRERLIDQIYECNLFQVDVLERTKECACDCNIEEIEKALLSCMEHRHCLDCIRYHIESDNFKLPVGS